MIRAVWFSNCSDICGDDLKTATVFFDVDPDDLETPVDARNDNKMLSISFRCFGAGAMLS